MAPKGVGVGGGGNGATFPHLKMFFFLKSGDKIM